MKLFFFDIDGTIIDCPNKIYVPTEKTISALKQLKAQGHKVFICSGRPYYFLDSSLKTSLFDGFVNSNGAIIREDDKILHKDVFPKKYILKFMEYAKKYHFSLMLEDQDDYYIYNGDCPCLAKFAKMYNIPFDESKLNDEVLDKTIMKMSIYFHDMENFDISWMKEFPTLRARYLKFGAFDIDSNVINKGTAVKFLQEYHHVKDEDLYAFGDGENDIEMLEACQNSVSMGVANELVQSKAKYHTLDVAHEGVYDFLKKAKLVK